MRARLRFLLHLTSDWKNRSAGAVRTIVDRLQGGRGDSYSTFSVTVYLLGEVNDPALRSACFQLLATLPGLSDYGAASDRLGRSGTAVGMTFDGVRTEIIVDPATSDLLQVENTIVSPQSTDVPAYRRLPAGTDLNSLVVLSHAVVTSDHTQP